MTVVSAIEPSPQITQAIARASRSTGVDFSYLLTTARRESAFKPAIKSNTSSATGLYQFIDQTWFAMVKKEGATIGLGGYARAIETTPGGHHDVADPKMRSAILALRKNPTIAAHMAGVFARQNGTQLGAALGREPSNGELYIAHFLGAGSAAKLISAKARAPEASAARLFPQAAGANKHIFYTRAGRARSVAQVYDKLTRTYGPGSKLAAQRALKAAPAQPPAARRAEVYGPPVPPELARSQAAKLFTRKIVPAGNTPNVFRNLFSAAHAPRGAAPATPGIVRMTPAHLALLHPTSAARADQTAPEAAPAPAPAAPVNAKGVPPRPFLHNLFTNGDVRRLYDTG